MPVTTMPRALLMACLLSSSLFGPVVSWALGLGEIHLNSALNEPMNAEIDLLAASPDELTALRATLASREAFTRYGIDKPPFLSTLTFKVGKSKDGRDVLLVRSADSIPEPFVTFLVEVNWARGRLMREYTVLLDPPVYAPGAGPAPAVTAPTVTAPAAPANAPLRRPDAAESPAPPATQRAAPQRAARAPARAAAAAAPSDATAADSVMVRPGDTLTRIARNLQGPVGRDAIDQTMIALFRTNPAAFGGNINVLRQGSVLRVPNADQIAALNQKEAISEVHRQIEAWRAAEPTAGASGHLRLVAPSAGGSATGAGSSSANGAETQALKEHIKELEGQLTESKRLIELRNSELAALQKKLGVTAAPAPVAPAPEAPAKHAVVPPPVVAAPPAAASSALPAAQTAPSAARPTATEPAPPPLAKKPASAPAPAPAATEGGSWIDWVGDNWWLPVALLLLVLGGLGFTAMRRRRRSQTGDLGGLDDTDVAYPKGQTAKIPTGRKAPESFVVEESGEHPAPDMSAPPAAARAMAPVESRSADDTISSESAVNLDQGDPLAEADFHMAYGLYDQAADLVRIALEREPERRDLRLKLLEIYFVWGNKDLFLQTAKGLEATRDRAPAGEWDKIVIMGKQICPEEPMFAANAGAGGGRGAGALVDLNLEGGENRVDIDLFGDPEGERSSLDHHLEKEGDSVAAGAQPGLHPADHLDFTLDTPERGADDSPTREMPPRDEPTVESELMNFGDANFLDPSPPESPTAEAPALRQADSRDRLAPKLTADQTAEVSIDDLGLDLDHLEETGSPSIGLSSLDETDHPTDAPTMVAGLDERSRTMMADAERQSRDPAPPARDIDATSRDRDLTELERELEASFVADLDTEQDHIKTAMLGPESAPTVLMPRDVDGSPTSRFKASDLTEMHEIESIDADSTSKLRSIGTDGINLDHSIDLDLDRLATALGTGDTVQQPQAEEQLFSTEVFEANETSLRNKRVDLDVGESLNGADSPTNKLKAQTNKLKPLDLAMPELEPVTMSEVGTKLDLARAYMDMGDPEGARSILEEVVQEGSASQKQEASRLIESLPG